MVMSADLEEVVMSVLFVCCRVWWQMSADLRKQ